MWLCLIPPVYRKAFKTQQFFLTQKNYIAQEKVKADHETVSLFVQLQNIQTF